MLSSKGFPPMKNRLSNFKKELGKTLLFSLTKGIILLAIAGCTVNQSTTLPTEGSPSSEPVTKTTIYNKTNSVFSQ